MQSCRYLGRVASDRMGWPTLPPLGHGILSVGHRAVSQTILPRVYARFSCFPWPARTSKVKRHFCTFADGQIASEKVKKYRPGLQTLPPPLISAHAREAVGSGRWECTYAILAIPHNIRATLSVRPYLGQDCLSMHTTQSSRVLGRGSANIL